MIGGVAGRAAQLLRDEGASAGALGNVASQWHDSRGRLRVQPEGIKQLEMRHPREPRSEP
jgi:hypothetical protein